MAEIMEMKVLNLTGFECSGKSPPNIRPVEGGSCLAHKNQISVFVPLGMLVLQEDKNRLIDRNCASFPVLGTKHRDCFPKQVDTGPRQSRNFAHPHARVESEQGQLAKPWEGSIQQAHLLFRR
jgi:hypothetical protein